MARTFAFWSLIAFAFFGAGFLRNQLASYVDALRRPIGGFVIPIISVEVTGALLIAAVVFAGCALLIWRWERKPKTVELLTETEIELRKTTWPTMPEVVNSSIVVIVCVLFLMGFLAGVDWFFGRIFRNILL